MKYDIENGNNGALVPFQTSEYKDFSKAMGVGFIEGKSLCIRLFLIARKAFLDVINHKIEALKNAYKIVKKMIRIITGKEHFPFRDYIDNFKAKTKSEKIQAVLNILLFLGMAFLTSGGLDLEGGFPDLDLKFGIGYHRNPISHSILGGLLTEFAFRFCLYVIKDFKLIKEKGRVREVFDKIDDNKDVFINGAWLGIFLHLFKDANILAERIKPLVWINGKSMRFHQLFLLYNALLSFLFTLGKSKEKS